MDYTEILVIGYHTKGAVAATLTPGAATTVHTRPGNDGQPTVETITRHTTSAFTTVREVLDGLAPASERP